MRPMLLPLALATGCSEPKPVDGAPSGPSDPTSPTTIAGDADTDPPGETPTTGDTGSPSTAPLESRDRLIRGYFDQLQLDPVRTMSNGLRGADLPDVCALWDGLTPSAQATFLTITARLEGSILETDGSTMLDHVVTAYRIVGGIGSTGTDPGDCGGEGNRLFVSIDPALHAALVEANQTGQGLADIPPGGAWHESGDLAGPHEPFTMSDETEDGAPRGQIHFFADPASAVANQPLGRVDVEDVVDPFAMEMDQDYDCVHNSNPACEYTFYGPLCLPEPTELGVTIYTRNYGSFDPTWRPTGC
jgi:hypothetical protein